MVKLVVMGRRFSSLTPMNMSCHKKCILFLETCINATLSLSISLGATVSSLYMTASIFKFDLVQLTAKDALLVTK